MKTDVHELPNLFGFKTLKRPEVLPFKYYKLVLYIMRLMQAIVPRKTLPMEASSHIDVSFELTPKRFSIEWLK